MKLPLLLLVLGIPGVAPEIHSLKFFYTGSSQVPNFPEFVAVTLLDEVQVAHYDSNTRKYVPTQDWMNKIIEDDPNDWKEDTENLKGDQQDFKGNIEIAKQRFNQTGGVHIFQVMYGCEWDDETGAVNGFEQFGYDGEDFLVSDLNTETFVAPVHQAVATKHKWDNNKALMAERKHYFTQECPEYLKKLFSFGRNSLMRTEFPSMYLLQKTRSSPVTCLATGFYPDGADLFWQRDGEELHEEVDRGEILPNHDGTFQMSVDLDLSSVPAEDWSRYTCVFHLAGRDVSRPLEERHVLTNRRPEFSYGPVIGGVIGGVLLLVIVAAGFFIMKRRRHGSKPANASETSSSSGEAQQRGGAEEQLMLPTAQVT